MNNSNLALDISFPPQLFFPNPSDVSALGNSIPPDNNYYP